VSKKRSGSSTRSERALMMRRQARRASSRPWYRAYRARIVAGEEHCRRCGVKRDDLTFGHLVAASLGTPLTMATVTILCPPCNQEQGTTFWELPSLASEEHDAPPERRWGALAYAADRAARESSVPGGMVAG
jgi:hypothetical protein